MNKSTILMYHYVKDLQNFRYPNIKVFDTKLFREQLNYFKKHYYFTTVEELVNSIETGDKIPKNSLLLTFDDGYKCSYDTVFPILHEEKIQGVFFPCVMPIKEGKLLDINKIHMILACGDEKDIYYKLRKLIDDCKDGFKLLSSSEYVLICAAEKDPYDTPETLFIKRMLQVVLPENARESFIDKLYKKFVDAPEHVLANEWYMNIEQMKVMQQNGMMIGSHGYSHKWLGKECGDVQREEVLMSVSLLDKIGVFRKYRTFCYPSNSYDVPLLDMLDAHGYKLGVIVGGGIADITYDNRLTLQRIDYPEMPYEADAEPNHYTKEVLWKSQLLDQALPRKR